MLNVQIPLVPTAVRVRQGLLGMEQRAKVVFLKKYWTVRKWEKETHIGNSLFLTIFKLCESVVPVIGSVTFGDKIVAKKLAFCTLKSSWRTATPFKVSITLYIYPSIGLFKHKYLFI